MYSHRGVIGDEEPRTRRIAARRRRWGWVAASMCLVAQAIGATPVLPWATAWFAQWDGHHDVQMVSDGREIRLVLSHTKPGTPLASLEVCHACDVCSVLLPEISWGKAAHSDHLLTFPSAEVFGRSFGVASLLPRLPLLEPIPAPIPSGVASSVGFRKRLPFSGLPPPASVLVARSTVFLV